MGWALVHKIKGTKVFDKEVLDLDGEEVRKAEKELITYNSEFFVSDFSPISNWLMVWFGSLFIFCSNQGTKLRQLRPMLSAIGSRVMAITTLARSTPARITPAKTTPATTTPVRTILGGPTLTNLMLASLAGTRCVHATTGVLQTTSPGCVARPIGRISLLSNL